MPLADFSVICVHKHGCVCVCVSFLQGKAEMNVRLSVMNLLNLWNMGVLELQGLPYAAQDRARGNVCMCVCVCVCVWGV